MSNKTKLCQVCNKRPAVGPKLIKVENKGIESIAYTLLMCDECYEK